MSSKFRNLVPNSRPDVEKRSSRKYRQALGVRLRKQASSRRSDGKPRSCHHWPRGWSGGLFDGPDEAIEDLLQDRHRRRKIQPNESRAIRIKRLAGAEGNARLIVKELKGRAGQLDPSAVEPGEIGRLGHME